jgi:hypothetical protein
MRISPQEIMDGLAEKNRLLSHKNDEYATLVEERAGNEREYNIATARKTMELRGKGEPIGLVDKLVKGDNLCAQLKYEFEVSLGVEKACLQSIKNLRSAIDTYRSLLSWLKSEMTGQ